MSSAAQVICVTPVRNEAWILERFLVSASLWADRIVVADQGSDDASRDIALRFPKVTLLENATDRYDEVARQRLLIDEARATPGRRLIVALDADEALAWRSWETEEWDALRHAPEGTVARFDWVNLLPGSTECWIPPARVPFAFVDDGTPHHGEVIHNTRVPVPPHRPQLMLDAVKVLHFQYMQWARMKSKQRWYQCWEMLHHPDKRPVQVYRQYHRMDAFPPSELHPVDSAWLDGYTDLSAGQTSSFGTFHWDQDIVEWLVDLGPRKFRRIDIWDVNWDEVAAQVGREVPWGALADPRSRVERAIHAWLRRTQPRGSSLRVRMAQRALIPLGW